MPAPSTSHDEHAGRSLPTTRKLWLSIGFLGLTVAAMIAWNAPATGYELSIYRATPWETWGGIAVAYAMAALVCAVNPRDRLAALALGLGGATTVMIAGLPLVRGYSYFGTSDALTHLGWVTDLRTGVMEPGELLYPGGHTMTVVIGEAFDLPTMRAMMIVMTLLVAVYVVFVPLTARALIPDPVVAVLAAFSGFLILPINNVSLHYVFHPYSLGVLLFPVMFYLLVKLLMLAGREATSSTTGLHAGLLLLGVALLFVHPQVMLNVVILLGVIVGVRLFARQFLSSHPLASLYPPKAVSVGLGVSWFVWTTGHWQFSKTTDSVIESTYMTFFGDQEVGQAAADAGDSAAAIGVSLWELFGKIFLVPSVFVALSGGLVVIAIVSSLHYHRRRELTVITYVGAGGVVLGPFFFLHFLGDVSGYFFRHLGFAMVLASVLGAIGMYVIATSLSPRLPRGTLRTLGVGLLAIALILSVATMYPSPHVYLPGNHVSDHEIRGYQTAIANGDEDVGWGGIRTGPGRFFDALTPDLRPRNSEGGSAANETELRHLLGGGVESDQYLPVSRRDAEREVIAYGEIRYSEGSLDATGAQPRVHHIQTNGGFDLYYVPSNVTQTTVTDEGPPPSNASVTVSETNGPVTAGEELHVEVQVENGGEEATEQQIELSTVSGEVLDAKTVVPEPGATESITLTWSTDAEDTGSHLLTVSSEDGSVSVEVTIESAMDPGALAISTVDSNNPIVAGEDLIVDVEIENTGDQPERQTVALEDVDGNVVDTTELRLDGAEAASVTLVWATGEDDAGEGTVGIRTDDDIAHTEVEIRDPGFFTVEIIDTNSPVPEEGELNVSSRIENTGDAPGEQRIALHDFDGEVVDTTTVFLEGSETTQVTLTWHTDEDDAGEDVVTVSSDDDADEATVEVTESGALFAVEAIE